MKLTTDFSPVDYTSLEVGGVTGKLYLIDYVDWLTAAKVFDPATGNITSITLTSVGAKAVEYDLPRGATIATTPLTINNGGKSGFTHTLQAFIPTKDMNIKKELACYINYRRAVAILVLDSSIVAQVFGHDVGLQVTAYEEAPNDPSKGGGLDVTFSTPGDVTLENLQPNTFFDTDRTTTLSAIEALKTAVV